MAADVDIAELSLDSAGQQLKRAREAAGKSLADISATTKVSERLLAAIEDSQFSALPSRIYALGFCRSYARVVGLDEERIVREVRAEMDGVVAGSEAPTAQAFAPGDPARVPGRRLAMAAGLAALLVVVAGLVFWHSAYNPAGSLPSILPADAPPVAVGPNAESGAVHDGPVHDGAAFSPTAPTGGAVAISALADAIWVKVYEATGKTLYEGQMKLGQTFAVPPDAQAPLIWTARPDALAITIAGKPVPKLSDTQKKLKGVPISAAALLARTAPLGAAAAPLSATASTAVE